MSQLISDLERQRASQRLQLACVEGFLSLDEFTQRVERAMAARTRGELSALVADLPIGAAPSIGPRPASTMPVVLSSLERSGSWHVPEHSSIAVVLGTCKLDLRRATVSARVTTIEARVVAGSLEVVVPGGVEVEVEAVTVASSKTVRLAGPPPRPDAPRIVVRGLVVLGSLKVHGEAHTIFELA